MSDPIARLYETTEDWLARRDRERDARSASFFASGEPIPELDLMPDCSICGGQVDYEDGRFWCDRCLVEWNRYGERGERDEDIAAERAVSAGEGEAP